MPSGIAVGEPELEEARALDDVAFRQLIRRMEQAPLDVTRLVLQDLYNQSHLETRRALMLAGPNVYSQLSPLIHATLDFDLVQNTEQQIRQLLAVSWLKHVQTLSLFDSRQSLSNPPQGQYSAIIEVLLELSNLRTARIHLPKSYGVVNISILDLLSTAPLLSCLHYLEMNITERSEASVSEEGSIAGYTRAGVDSSFESLKTLFTLDVSLRALAWMHSRFSRATGTHTRVGNLVTMQLDLDRNPLRDILSFIVCQANSLKKLRITRVSRLDDDDDHDGEHQDQCFPVSMPKLELLSCSTYHPYGLRSTMDDCAALLHFIEAPALRILGCGHILDCHSTQICRRLAIKWLRTSQLRQIVAGHFETLPSESHEVFFPRDTLVLRNLEAVEVVFADKKLKILSLGAEDYRDHFHKQMDGENKSSLSP